MTDQAEVEGELLNQPMPELELCAARQSARRSSGSSAASRGGGGGFGVGGGGGGKSAQKKTKKKAGVNSPGISPATQRLVEAARLDGVVRVPSVLCPEKTAALRAAIVTELELMRSDIRADPTRSVDYFYVPAEIHFSTPRGYILLPFCDRDAHDEGADGVGPIVTAARELLGKGSQLADLFGELCGAASGVDPQLYDWCSLRTEPGAARQLVHADTPFQATPGLFCAFVALQDVEVPMGGTLFLPGTHLQTPERARYDAGGPAKSAMLANAAAAGARRAHLKAGDAVVFDMRVLHAGLPNLAEGGAPRFLLAVTFRNPAARGALGHRPNLRPGYVGRHTLASFQAELAGPAPFAAAGDGVLAASSSSAT